MSIETYLVFLVFLCSFSYLSSIIYLLHQQVCNSEVKRNIGRCARMYTLAQGYIIFSCNGSVGHSYKLFYTRRIRSSTNKHKAWLFCFVYCPLYLYHPCANNGKNAMVDTIDVLKVLFFLAAVLLLMLLDAEQQLSCFPHNLCGTQQIHVFLSFESIYHMSHLWSWKFVRFHFEHNICQFRSKW